MDIYALPAPAESRRTRTLALVLLAALSAACASSPVHGAQWETCLTDEDVDERIGRYKTSVEEYQARVEALEAQLERARGTPAPEPPPAPQDCALRQLVLDELSNTRSALAVREGELQRLGRLLDEAEAEAAAARERIAQLEASPAPPAVPPGSATETAAKLEQALAELDRSRQAREALQKRLERQAETLAAQRQRLAELEAASGPAAGTAGRSQQDSVIARQEKMIADLRAALAAYELGSSPSPRSAPLQRQLDEAQAAIAERDDTIAHLRAELQDRQPEPARPGPAPANPEPAASGPATPAPTPTTTVEARHYFSALPKTEPIEPRRATVRRRADVYEAPTLESALVGILGNDRAVELVSRSVGTEPAWYEVRTTRGAAGWVRASQLVEQP